MYIPQPIDTSQVQLPDDIGRLQEQLAKNTHEVWAQQRIADGWQFGPQRNDACKEHPGLVPYEELSEEEREYDRITATQTLKLILALGYSIVKGETT